MSEGNAFKTLRIYNGGNTIVQLGLHQHETQPNLSRPVTVITFPSTEKRPPGWPENGLTLPELVMLREIIDAAIKDQMHLIAINTGQATPTREPEPAGE